MSIERVSIFFIFIASFVSCLVFPPTWDEIDAENKLMYSYAVFCGNEAIMKWDCYWCKKADIKPLYILHNPKFESYGFIGVNRNQIVVTFRGSKTIENWIQNLKFFKISYKSVQNALVHQGFYESFQSIRNDLHLYLKNVTKRFPHVNEIAFTGHSHGAAIATLASLDIVESGLYRSSHRIYVTHFGSPRIGNDAFARHYEKLVPTIRLTHAEDTVPHLPPSFFGYHHPVREIWEKSSRVYQNCSYTNGEDPTCSNSNMGLNLDDHLLYMGYHVKEGKC